VSNKVRPGDLGLGGDDTPPAGPHLYMLTLGSGSIQDVGQPLASKRYLATLVHDWDGWILSVNTPPSSHGPFPTAEDAFAWWLEHRHNLPPGRTPPGTHSDWPPGSPWDIDDE
jgi:hypothetical protein